MLRPMLLVGVGGSGGKTLQLLHRELRWRLSDAGWNEGVPAGWQFIHIDAPSQPDTALGDGADLINSVTVGGSYVPLSIAGVNYGNVDQVWLDGATSDELATVASWRPRPSDVGIALEMGAGQYRTIGRVMALSQANKIQQHIGNAMAKITAPDVQPELQRLTLLLGGDATGVDQSPQAIIVSSIAGGSGAGMYLDIADIIRSFGVSGWQSNSMGILYTADVFSDITPNARAGVMPNSLAALCELMAGYWNGNQPEAEYGALERRGIPVGGFTRRGIRFPLLVGRANGRVDYPTQQSVYQASAKTLAGFMTSPVAQNSIIAYLTGNWTSTASGLTDNSGLKDGVKETVVSAMGMGSLSLGRDRFARYTSQRLSRATVEYLLRHHTDGLKVPEEVSPEDALSQAVLRNVEWFIDSCHMDEIGAERNQVLDALRPDISVHKEDVRRTIRNYINQFGDPQAPTDWSRLIIAQAEEQERQFISITDAAIREIASSWVMNIQSRIIDAYLEAMARNGLDVATALLGRLYYHVDDVIGDLTTEVKPLQNDAARRDEGVHGAFNTWSEALLLRDNELLDEAIRRVVIALEWGFEARLRAVTCTLLKDLSQNFLNRLYTASDHALDQLRTDEHPPPGAPGVGIETWPTPHIIPPALMPALNERLVEPVEAYPGAYETNLIATTRRDGDHVPWLQAERRAIGEIATGRAKGLDKFHVVEQLNPWWPAMLSSQEPASTAGFKVNCAASDLLERAERWVHRRDTAMGEYVHASLRDYVLGCEVPTERADRQRRVLDAFREVLAVSPPLVRANNALMSKVHPEPIGIQYHFTSIPFDQSEMRDEIEAIASNAGLTPDRIAALNDAFDVGDKQRIEIITTLSAPIEPVVLESVMRPIAEQWIKSKTNPGERSSFWRWRRARPLYDFIPLSPDVRRAVERGWFVGRLLGEVRWDGEDFNHSPIRIWDGEFNREVELPFPLIGPQLLNDTDLLPAVLESVGLAMVECHVQSSMDPLRPYQLLRRAGEESAQTLTRWIRFGTTRLQTEPIDRAWRTRENPINTRAEATPEDRKTAVITYLSGRIRNYVENLDPSSVSMANLGEQPRHLDLRTDMAAIFDELISSAAAVQTDVFDEGGD